MPYFFDSDSCWSLRLSLELGHVLLLSLRNDVVALHVRADLIRNFFEDLFGQITPGDGLVELYELDDITGNTLAHRILQRAIVAIELIHLLEVCIAHSNNDDGTG